MSALFQSADWYDTPHYYDIIFGTDTIIECDFLQTMREWYGQSRGKRVLEPACGSGRLVEEMARRGYTVTGFDRNERMLRYTRRRLVLHGLRAPLHVCELDEFDFRQSFDLAHCLVSTFKYLRSERSARNHLQCVATCLKLGGVYVLGFHLSQYGSVSKTRERWVASRDGTTVTCNTQFWPPAASRRTERVRARLTVEEHGRTHRMETNWLFRTYDAAQVRRLLRSVPALEHVATYDFTYDVGKPSDLTDDQLDVVLILRRT